MTPALLAELQQLSEAAKLELKTGSLPDLRVVEERYAVVRPLKHQFTELPLAQRVLVLDFVRRLGDIADRLGHYDKAAEILDEQTSVFVDDELAKVDKATESAYLEAIAWWMIVYSVTKHRKGDAEMGLKLVLKADKVLQHLPEEDFPIVHGRRHYALGRHSQAIGSVESRRKAEEHFCSCLRMCSMMPPLGDDGLDYASYRMGITLIALARLCLQRGELARSRTHLFAARMLLTHTPKDSNTGTLADFLMASIDRQTAPDVPSRTKVADRLRVCLERFRRARHQRYFLRCRHELALTLYNLGRYREALAQLSDPLEGTPSFVYDPAAESRSNLNDVVLSARVLAALAQSDDDLEIEKEKLNNALLALWNKTGSDAPMRARALIVRAEIDLRLGHVEPIEENLAEVTSGQTAPVNPADVAWAWLVVGEARLQLGKVAAALEAHARYTQAPIPVENILLKPKAEALYKAALGKSGDILVFDKAQGLDFHARELQLKDWLVNQVQHAGGLDEQAKLLGISRNTLEGWYNALHREAPIRRHHGKKSAAAGG